VNAARAAVGGTCFLQEEACVRSFKIEVRGHPYRGLWRLAGEDRIEVRTDYGTVWASLQGRVPGDVARQVLSDLVPPPMWAEPRR
jgi:hypothetical protein